MKQLVAAILALAAIPAFAQVAPNVQLKIGSVTVPPGSLSSGGCVQVPIFINDTQLSDRQFKDLTFTVEIGDPSGVISGGIATPMLVANAFGAGANFTGLTNPGTDLSNVSGVTTPTCATIFNPATQGQSPPIDFAMGAANGTWSINNNGGGVGTKVGFVVNLGGLTLASNLTQNQDFLVGVLEIPIISSPGTAQIQISATSNDVVADANIYTWDGGGSITSDFRLPSAPATVSIVDAVDCSGATTMPTNPTWADPQDGGIGGALLFTFPGTTNADRVHLISSDGLDVIIPSAGATTTYSIDTTNDGSPSAGANRSYTASYEVEFPPASGTFASGASCNLSPDFAPATATIAFDPMPAGGQPTALDITLTNAQFSSARYANLTGPSGLNIDLVGPSAGAGSNILAFSDVVSISAVSDVDIGTYTVSGISAAGEPFSASTMLGLPPPVNNTNCAAIAAADIGAPVTVPLAGNDGTIDFTVIYNGVTTTGVPAGPFMLPNNVVGNSSLITVQANGFDTFGNPFFDQLVCTIDYSPPTCNATQSPDSTVTPVDPGTVITLTLATTNGVTATVDGVPMVQDVTPNINFNVAWEATHTAVADATLSGVATNPDGEMVNCTWLIDINVTPGIDVSPISGLQTTEAGGSDSFSVVLQSQPNADVQIGLSSSDPTEGTPDAAMLTFTSANWDTPQTVTVTGVDDAVVDGDIAYSIITAPATSADGLYNDLNPDDVSASNSDDDTAGIRIDDVSLMEGTGANTVAMFSVTLDTAIDGGFTVDYASADGSATSPADYTAVSGTLNFAGTSGEIQTIAVTVIGDSVVEATESFTVNLGAISTQLVSATDPNGLATILDDDERADLALTLSITSQAGGVGEFHTLLAEAVNNGPTEAQNVLIEIDVPQGLLIASSTASSGGICSAAPPVAGQVRLSCSYAGSTASGATRSVEAVLQAATPGQFEVSASVSSDTPDPVANNNTASVAFGAVAQQIPSLHPAMLALLALLLVSLGSLSVRFRD